MKLKIVFEVVFMRNIPNSSLRPYLHIALGIDWMKGKTVREAFKRRRKRSIALEHCCPSTSSDIKGSGKCQDICIYEY